MDSPKKIETNPFRTRQEMAKELGISVRTFRRKLKAKQIELSGGLLSIQEQIRIYEAFGLKTPASTKPQETKY